MPENYKNDQALVCIEEGVHGKFWRVGDTATAGRLKQLGGFVPEYFKPAGSKEAADATDDVGTDGKGLGDGFKNNDARRNFLIAKGVTPNASATKAELEAMISEVQGSVTEDPLAD